MDDLVLAISWHFFAVAMIPFPFFMIAWSIKWVLGNNYDT